MLKAIQEQNTENETQCTKKKQKLFKAREKN